MNIVATVLLLFCALLWFIVLVLAAVNRAGTGKPPKSSEVIAGYAITAALVGIIGCAFGFIVSWTKDLQRNKLVMTLWSVIALVALWFSGASLGLWAWAEDLSSAIFGRDLWDRWQAEMAFHVVVSFFWIITWIVLVLQPTARIGFAPNKMIAIVLLVIAFVVSLIAMALSAANHNGANKVNGVKVDNEKVQVGLGVAGGVFSMVVTLIVVLLVFTQTWAREDSLWGIIRGVLLFVGLVGLWLLAGAVGIWGENARRGGVVWDNSDSFKAEMAFQIIASFFLIIAYVFATSWSYATSSA